MIPLGGLPIDYTITENDLKLTVKVAGGFAPVTPKTPRFNTPSAPTSTTGKRKNDTLLTQTSWKRPKCGWMNKAQNKICGGPMESLRDQISMPNAEQQAARQKAQKFRNTYTPEPGAL